MSLLLLYGSPAATALLSGSATLTAAAVAEIQATASLTAVGTLTASADGPLATGTLTGTATLTAAALLDAQISTTLTGPGTLTAAAVADLQASAALAGTATLTATGPGGSATLAVVALLRAAPTVDLDLYRTMVLADGPIGYWRLGESAGTQATDWSGNDLHGTYVASPTLQVTGALRNTVHKAVTFNGSTQYVDLGSPAELQAGNVSVEAWFKTASEGLMSVYRWRFYGIDLRMNLGQVVAQVYKNTTEAINVWSPAKYSDNKWHHAVATFDGTTLHLYIDGIERVSTAFGVPGNAYYVSGAGNGAAIARDGTSSGQYFGGSLDEVAVYDYALSPAQIQEHFSRAAFQSGWFYVRDLPISAYVNAGVALNNLFYSIGGFSGNYLQTVYMFDPVLHTWTQKAPYPLAAYGIAACAHNGKIYTHGGYTGFSRADLYDYDPATNTWNLSHPASQFGLANHGLAPSAAQNKLYVFGNLSVYQVYDLATKTWSTGSMSSPRTELRAASHPNGKIYVSGGTGSALMQEFDPATGTFTQKASIPAARASHGFALFANLMWVFGGHQAGYQKTVWSYDPLTNSWTAREDMLVDRYQFAAAALDAGLIAAGGFNNSGSRTVVERYVVPVTSATAAIPITMDVTPYPVGEATIALNFDPGGDAEEVGGTRVFKPGLITVGYYRAPDDELYPDEGLYP